MPRRDYEKIESAPETSLPDIQGNGNRQTELIALHAKTYREQLEKFRSRLVDEALNCLDAPSVKYRNQKLGKSLTEGFDCSGFVVYLLNKLYKEFSDLPLPSYPRLSNKFFDRYGVFIPWGRQQAGDLMFIYRQSQGWYVDHMGIMLDPHHYIHAPGKDGTKVQVVKITRQWKMKNRDPKAPYEYNPVGFKRIAVEVGRWRIG